jgi:protease-4
MASRADDLIDRRHLRRKLTFWRIAAILFVAIGIVGVSAWLYRADIGGSSVNHIAKVKIEGTILEDQDLLDRLKDIRESSSVKGVIVAINSPGGTTAGGEAIFDAVRELAGEKPVVAQVGTLAASAGYMIASATDHIVARQSSIVGSIGVLVQFPNFTGLMEKVGITLDEIKSSPLKAEPSPFNPTTDEERAMIRSLIMDSYEWFVGLIVDRRGMSRAEVLALADGSIFTGRQAVENKLVDQLGGEKEAVAWLEGKGVEKDLKVVEWKPKEKGAYSMFFGSSLVNAIAERLGFPGQGADLLKGLGADRIFLDGLVSVWQPLGSSSGRLKSE